MKSLRLFGMLTLMVLSFASCNKVKEKVLIGTINQSQESAPTFSESKNKVCDITWKRNAKGIYQGDFSEKLDGELFVHVFNESDISANISTHITSDYVQVFTTRNGEFEDGILINIGIEIKQLKK